jgi:hypothetical protein
MDIPEFEEDTRIDELLEIVLPKLRGITGSELVNEIHELVDRLLNSNTAWTKSTTERVNTLLTENKSLQESLLFLEGGTA